MQLKGSYEAVIDRDENGEYVVTFPDCKGCITDGKTIEECITNAKEALELWLTVGLERKMPLPLSRKHKSKLKTITVPFSIKTFRQPQFRPYHTVGELIDALSVLPRDMEFEHEDVVVPKVVRCLPGDYQALALLTKQESDDLDGED